MIPSLPVQSKIYEILVAADVCDGRVYDATVTNPAVQFPYLEIGETQVLSDDVSGRGGNEEFLSLHIWSRHRGKSEVREICDQIRVALHAQVLTVTDMDHVSTFIRDLRSFRDPDGLTEHGVVTVIIHSFETLSMVSSP